MRMFPQVISGYDDKQFCNNKWVLTETNYSGQLTKLSTFLNTEKSKFLSDKKIIPKKYSDLMSRLLIEFLTI